MSARIAWTAVSNSSGNVILILTQGLVMQSSTGAVREIWETSRTAFGEAIPNFSPADQLVVEEGTHRLKLTYVSPPHVARPK